MKSIKLLDKNWVLLFISLLLGGVAAWAVGQYLKVKESEIKQQYTRTDIVKVPVVVAVTPLSKGDLLTPDKVVVREIPQDYVPDDAIHPNDFGIIANKLMLSNVQPGKPILMSYVPKTGEEQFSDILKPGRRAVTININENNSNANMLVPGDYIDLYLSQKKNDKSLQLILERVTVLATGRQSISEKDKLKKSIFGQSEAYSTITLDLSTMDAGRVSLAQEYGSFVALLRNRKDELQVSSTLIKEADVFLHNDREHQVEYIIGGSGGIAKGVTKENKIDKPVSQFKTFANKVNSSF